MNLTQTAITLRLKHLESELGMTLFLRSRRGMTLTEEGKALVQLCRGQKELEGQFLGQISGSGRREISLTIAGPTSAISSRVADATLNLYQKYPFLNLHLKADDHSDLIELIRRGEADLAIVSPHQVPKEMDSKIIRADKYLLVATSNWKGRKLSDILENERIIDFYESDTTTQKYLKQFDLERRVNSFC